MIFSGVVSMRRLRAMFALELTELRLCFYTKNKRRNFHSACRAALPRYFALRANLARSVELP